jgi:hypothetical protein
LPLHNRDRKQIAHFAVASFGKAINLVIGVALGPFQIKNPAENRHIIFGQWSLAVKGTGGD